jgi:hypothetical protein
MKTLALVLLSAITLTSTAQTTKKTLELAEFNGIYVNSNYSVQVKQSNKQEVVVDALAEIYQLTEIKVEDGILMINVERKPDEKNKSIWAKIDDIKLNPTMKIMVSMKNVSKLYVNGGGKIESENSIASDNIEVGVAGSGSMNLDIKGNIVKTEVSGSGNLTLSGYATTNDILVSGTGTLSAFKCELESAKIKLSGSGNAEIAVSSTLDAYVMGSGSIKHKGNTKNVTKKIFGSGSIDRAY